MQETHDKMLREVTCVMDWPSDPEGVIVILSVALCHGDQRSEINSINACHFDYFLITFLLIALHPQELKTKKRNRRSKSAPTS